ncbi:MAG: AAA family ATPase [Oligoflexales bacterium]|nr:AAA family ATPase [Oligoflexales bacterium]
MSDKNFPKPEDIQKEFEEFVQKRFGGQVHVITQELPLQSLNKKKTKREERTEEKFSLSFDLKPKDIKAHLDRFIVEQDEAKKALAIAVCDHYNQVISHLKDPQSSLLENYVKQNVLILGPTGVGKTYMIRQIARLVGVPFVKADATRFSETGYVGANVDDLIRDLVHQADGHIEKAQCGIIYLDEGDKLASASQTGQMGGRDVSGRGVQLGLLKLMEETELDLRAGHDPVSQMQAFMEMQQKGKVEKQVVNTRHILFIVSGAFTGLESIISKRLNRSKIGFTRETDRVDLTDQILQHASTQDFIDFGFEPEFVGRLPVRVACHHLNEEALCLILENSEGSIVQQYKNAFKAYGIEAVFTREALQAVASMAVQEKTGARGLMTILERVFRDYKFELPSANLATLAVTEDLIRHPQRELKKILEIVEQEHQLEVDKVRGFETKFEEKFKIQLLFDRQATRYLCLEAQRLKTPIDELCRSLLLNYEHGLKLIEQNTGQHQFTLTEEHLKNSSQTLEMMVKESYTNRVSR